MIEDTGTTGCPFNEPTDVTISAPFSDHILPLAVNGGPTRTHALTDTSGAKNLIPNGVNGCQSGEIDQRGFLRSSGDGARCDAGAYEVGADVVPTAIDLQAVSADGSDTFMENHWLVPLTLGTLLLLFTLSLTLRSRHSQNHGKD